MQLSLYNLSKEQISVIKGIGIILIVFHNFIHLQSGVGENEIFYSQTILINMLEVIEQDFTTLFNSLISYFGHFGVQLFIFASGYGLTKKYLYKKINYPQYIISYLIKIYSLVIVGLIFYVILNIRHITLSEGLHFALTTLSMTNNLSYSTAFTGVGPWWFFSFIIQAYLIFPLLFLLMRYNSKMLYSLLLISYCLIYLLAPIFEAFNIPLFLNLPGHLPEFILGISLAMHPDVKIDIKAFLVSVIIFIVANLSVYTFPLSFLSACIIMLFIFQKLYSNTKTYIYKKLLFIGNISMIMFVINGITRGMVYTRFFDGDFSPLYLSFISVLYFIFVVIISYLISLLYNKTFIPLYHKLGIKK